MIVRPSWVNEYSKALALDLAACRVINPVDSRLRKVLVSMRWETFPTLRSSSPCREGLASSEKRISGVHLPIKIAFLFFAVLDITCCLVPTR